MSEGFTKPVTEHKGICQEDHQRRKIYRSGIFNIFGDTGFEIQGYVLRNAREKWD